MQIVMLILTGFFIGGFIVRWLMMRAEHRHARPHHVDPHYLPAVRAVRRHIHATGTINPTQAERLLSIHAMTAMRYLEQMERDGMITSQGHRDSEVFYTI